MGTLRPTDMSAILRDTIDPGFRAKLGRKPDMVEKLGASFRHKYSCRSHEIHLAR
jgi:hypothetical protein